MRSFPLKTLSWIAFACLLVVEFILIDNALSRFHCWVYPRWNDQIQYLTEAYTGWEYLKQHGLFAGLWQTFTNPSAQGTLADFYAVIIFLAAGPSRSAALAVNVVAFLVLQSAFFLGATRSSGSSRWGWLAVSLLLLLGITHMNAPGTMCDFRLDFLAFCTLGVTFIAAIQCDRFETTRWSVAFGVMVGITIVTRFLTGAYLAPIIIIMMLWSLCAPDRRLARLCNGALAAVTAAIIAAPFFWLNKQWVWDYYFIGHFTGPESAIRSPNMGLMKSSQWILDQLLQNHLGSRFILIASILVTVSAAANLTIRFFRRTDSTETPADIRAIPAHTNWIITSAIFLLVPACILALHSQKSSVVLSILIPGTVGLIMGLVMLLLQNSSMTSGLVGKISVSIAAISVCAGLHFQVTALIRNPHSKGFQQDARSVNLVAGYIFDQSRAMNLTNPAIGVDFVSDAFDAQILRVVVYERKKQWVPFVMTLPTGIMKDQEETLFKQLANSDFMYLTNDPGPAGYWPYDHQMAALRPALRQYCESNFTTAMQLNLFGRNITLYQRPTAKKPQ